MPEMMIEFVDMDGYEPDVLYTKGHVDLAEFIEAAGKFVEYRGEGLPPEAAHYAWIRYNPDPSGQWLHMVTDGTPGNRGTFPATVSYSPDRRFRLFKEWPRMPAMD